MKLFSKIASIALVAILPVALATPASAVVYDRLSITVDCVIGETGDDNHIIGPSDVLTVTFANCDGSTIEDNDSTGNATMPDNTVIDNSGSQTISGNSFAVTVVGAADLEVDDDSPDVDVYEGGEIDDPSSTLLATEDMTLGLSAPETMIREDAIGQPGDDGSGGIYLDGDPACQLEPGVHVYETFEFEVTESGVYDFRAIAVTPLDEDLDWGFDYYPSSDPFLALFETFNPALPETGLVGCNDDGDDTGVSAIDTAWYDAVEDRNFRGMLTESGDMIDDQWPWFQATLDPGNYTLVYMPFRSAGTDDYAQGQYSATSIFNPTAFPEYTWDPIAQDVTYEMWGPAGGIVLGGEGLAPTGGVEPSFALWAGLGIVGVGVAVAVARRREQRA